MKNIKTGFSLLILGCIFIFVAFFVYVLPFSCYATNRVNLWASTGGILSGLVSLIYFLFTKKLKWTVGAVVIIILGVIAFFTIKFCGSELNNVTSILKFL